MQGNLLLVPVSQGWSGREALLKEAVVFRCNELLETSRCSGKASGMQSRLPTQLNLRLQAGRKQAFLSAFISSRILSSLKLISGHLCLWLHYLCITLSFCGCCIMGMLVTFFFFYWGSLINFTLLLKIYFISHCHVFQMVVGKTHYVGVWDPIKWIHTAILTTMEVLCIAALCPPFLLKCILPSQFLSMEDQGLCCCRWLVQDCTAFKI